MHPLVAIEYGVGTSIQYLIRSICYPAAEDQIDSARLHDWTARSDINPAILHLSLTWLHVGQVVLP